MFAIKNIEMRDDISENDFLKYHVFFMKIFGYIRPTDKKQKFIFVLLKIFGYRPTEKKKKFIFMQGIILFLMLLILTIIQIKSLLENIQGASINFSCSVVLFVITVRLTFLMFYREEVLMMINRSSDFISKFKESKVEGEIKIFGKFCGDVKKNIYGIAIPMSSYLLVQLICFIFKKDYLLKSYFNELFPFLDNLFIGYVIQVFMGFLYWFSDTFYIVLLSYINFRLEILNLRWRHFEKNSSKNFLKDQIEDRADIVKEVEEFEEFSKVSVYIFYMSHGSAICFAIIQASLRFEKQNLFFCLCGTVTLLLSLYLFFKQGDDLLSKSNETSSAIFECDWLEMNLKQKKEVLIAMQAPTITLKAFYVKINLITFVEVVNGAYDFFNFVMTVRNK